MTAALGPPRLSAAERAALIAGARQERDPQVTLGHAKAEIRTPISPSFDNLPGYDAIRLQRAFADRMGLAAPFYRVHDCRAGAHSRVDGIECVNFTSYDYLGLNAHPEIVVAVAEAAERWGTSVSASRLTSGERPFHAILEGELARLYGAGDALLFVSGHATNLAVIGTIVGPGDLVIHDALAHNSIVVGAEQSGAGRRNFPHNDIAALDRLLASVRHEYRHCLVVTEGLFSMDGDGPDLARLVEVKQRHGA
jgi:7-keto-8-aminopelargonate synthetase-like enzyme